MAQKEKKIKKNKSVLQQPPAGWREVAEYDKAQSEIDEIKSRTRLNNTEALKNVWPIAWKVVVAVLILFGLIRGALPSMEVKFTPPQLELQQLGLNEDLSVDGSAPLKEVPNTTSNSLSDSLKNPLKPPKGL